MGKDKTEDTIRDSVIRSLYGKIGKVGSLRGKESSPAFDVDLSWGGGSCRAEGALEYQLPSGLRLSHKNDILITLSDFHQVAVEIKVLSNVTDQFKCRSYDAMHLKPTLGDGVFTILVYVRPPAASLTTKRAKAIAYAFDRFIGIEIKGPDYAAAVQSATERIAAEISGILQGRAEKKQKPPTLS